MKKWIYTFYDETDLDEFPSGSFESDEDDLDWRVAELTEEHDAKCAEYPDERKCFVRLESGGPTKKFTIWAELMRHYSASEDAT